MMLDEAKALSLEQLMESLLQSRNLAIEAYRIGLDYPEMRPFAWSMACSGLTLGHVINKMFPDLEEHGIEPLSPDGALSTFFQIKLRMMRDYPPEQLEVL